mmetsp:Transcript_28074/g.59268  ORF Transcript_28074/g.59268 Transcript_28074/m.59268 type:complete len:209 (+) Transcript_28074:167-793(+)|eukprot:CAMPEP_0183729146 /NCGR_PEP_ID=MMETSP0737-20130205/29819_1 /TAXON_ID=385413 /ORGANISM="Thalassiosira miniscula, Strain CCMP1093" /LENGTH=208 /DNA_ID=CAMNT_0025961267 /DNA_START=61 /DNA_END=687 /DNA_ORIENTATION=-
MDLSSIDHSSDSGADTDNDGDELIPVAVPVAVAAVIAHRDDDDSDDEGDDEAVGKESGGGLETTFDTADGMDEETHSHATELSPPPPSASKKRSNSEISDPPSSSAALTESAKKKKYNDGRPRQPAAKGLTIPFRTIKRIMKIDTDIGIVQNDAAIVATAALEMFVKEFATKSLEIAKAKGRNTIKYDDVAEVRANNRALSFLDILMP